MGFDRYQRYDGSIANILRQIWVREPCDVVAKLNLDLIERWKLEQLQEDNQPSKYQEHVLAESGSTALCIARDDDQSIYSPCLSG